MKRQYRTSFFALACSAWFCLLVACTSTASVDSPQSAAPPDEVAGGDAPGGGQTEAQPTDIIDRVFSPLDDAVDTINRDLNKNDTDTAATPNE
jgi:hypothetical protein